MSNTLPSSARLSIPSGASAPPASRRVGVTVAMSTSSRSRGGDCGCGCGGGAPCAASASSSLPSPPPARALPASAASPAAASSSRARARARPRPRARRGDLHLLPHQHVRLHAVLPRRAALGAVQDVLLVRRRELMHGVGHDVV
eukprot:31074-Pelagococcus_subviridis.AAC.29